MNISPTTTSFAGFPKVARLSREMIVTEKIDGTNAQIFIWDERYQVTRPGADLLTDAGRPPDGVPFVWTAGCMSVAAGSRTQWITPANDNHGFVKWVLANVEQLVYLGHGRHFGEWWGSGINRGYGLSKGEKRLSLFNTIRWAPHGTAPQRIVTGDPRIEKFQDVLPTCVGLVPIMDRGLFSTGECKNALEQLRIHGSVAAPGYMNPEGIVVFHTASGSCFKKTLAGDGKPKRTFVSQL